MVHLFVCWGRGLVEEAGRSRAPPRCVPGPLSALRAAMPHGIGPAVHRRLLYAESSTLRLALLVTLHLALSRDLWPQ